MHKYKMSDVKSFEFSSLEGMKKSDPNEAREFNFKTFEQAETTKIPADTIRKERMSEERNGFKVNDVVRLSRGLVEQEKSDYENRVQEEVKRRLEISFKEALSEGREKGREEGKKEILSQLQSTVDEKVSALEQVINEVKAQSESLLLNNKNEITDFVKKFTKWVIMKEVNEKVYLEALFEKLLLEINSRKNLIIKVGQNNFGHMPEVITAVESRLGNLTNIRIEVVPEVHHPGIIIESENGLIDGSLENIFTNIDKIFEQVMVNE